MREEHRTEKLTVAGGMLWVGGAFAAIGNLWGSMGNLADGNKSFVGFTS